MFFTKLQEDYTGRDSLGNLQLGDRKSSSNLGSCAPHKQILLGKKEVSQESPKSLYLGAALYNIMTAVVELIIVDTSRFTVWWRKHSGGENVYRFNTLTPH